MYETHVTMVGTVINEPQQRKTMEGLKVVNFRVAANERRFDRETGDWKDGERLVVSVACWRKLAHGVAMSLAKGDPVVVTGRLYTRGYELEGQQRLNVQLDATSVGPDLARCTAEVQRNRRDMVSDSGGAQLSESGPRGVAGTDEEAGEREGVAA